MFDKINKAVSSVLPPELGTDVKNNVEAVMRSGFEKMDLVTREQFDIQQKILERTREKVRLLEERVEQLEAETSKSA
ncbi:MAG: accessory factor UbiK family protein [Gammaproteobacteria bacterium]|nr:accessory factor UbiK family protein [Gammaproteobacteria bacterium]NKB65364.1 accessory factor UbiK family protein [Gammaproteobacteria bacterium]